MKVLVNNAIHVPTGELPPKVLEQLLRALEFPNPEFVKRQRLGKWLGDLEETVRSYQLIHDDRLLVLPRGAVGILKGICAEAKITIEFDDARTVFPPQPLSIEIPLRDYQKAAVEKLAKAPQGILVMPCGSGKTVTALALIARLGQPTLVLTHTKDLLSQWKAAVQQWLGFEPAEISAASKTGLESDKPLVTVGMVPSISRLSDSAFVELMDDFGCAVLDECLPADARVMVRGKGARSIAECVLNSEELEVLSYNHTRKEPEYRRVIARTVKTVKRQFVTLRIRLKTRRVLNLRVTAEHPVYVEGRGYVPALEIKPGEQVLALGDFYPCRECHVVFDNRSSLGGHVNFAHRNGKALFAKAHRLGGFCAECGKWYESRHALTTHIRRHADPVWDEKIRKENSRRMRATNLRRSELLRVRMQEKNPMVDPLVREKIRRSHWIREPHAYVHLDGGNGNGPTLPEQSLHERLGEEWKWQFVVPTGSPRREGIPTHYKLDLAHPVLQLAIEIDGNSHRSRLGKERDERKTTWLTANGWRVLRFRNEEVNQNLEAVIAAIEERQ
jgi:hypothetical protein